VANIKKITENTFLCGKISDLKPDFLGRGKELMTSGSRIRSFIMKCRNDGVNSNGNPSKLVINRVLGWYRK